MKTLVMATLGSLLHLAGCGGNDGTTISATGTIEAVEITLSAQAGGVVLTTDADEGDRVAKGDTLLKIDPSEWNIQLRQAEGNLEAAEAQYRLAVQGARREDVASAEASYTNAQGDLARMKELLESKSIPRKQFDDAEMRYILAQQNLEKAKRGSRPEEIAAARGRRDQADAQVDLLRKKVADCAILAPLSATVVKRFVEQGELVAPGMALMRLANLSELDLMIYVPETDLPKVSLGQSAEVRVDAFPDRPFAGTVVSISSVAEFTPKSIQTKDERTKLVFGVKVKVNNPDGALKAGIPADVTLVVP